MSWQKYHDRHIGGFLRKHFAQEQPKGKDQSPGNKGQSSKTTRNDDISVREEIKSTTKKVEPLNKHKQKQQNNKLSKEDFKQLIIIPLSKEYSVLKLAKP